MFFLCKYIIFLKETEKPIIYLDRYEPMAWHPLFWTVPINFSLSCRMNRARRAGQHLIRPLLAERRDFPFPFDHCCRLFSIYKKQKITGQNSNVHRIPWLSCSNFSRKRLLSSWNCCWFGFKTPSKWNAWAGILCWMCTKLHWPCLFIYDDARCLRAITKLFAFLLGVRPISYLLYIHLEFAHAYQ